MKSKIALVTAAAALLVTSAVAQSFQQGDVVVSTVACTFEIPPGPCQSFHSRIVVYGSDGVFKRTLIESDGVYGDLLVDSAGNVWVRFERLDLGQVGLQKVSPAGNLLAFYPTMQSLLRLALAADGRIIGSSNNLHQLPPALFTIAADGSTSSVLDLGNEFRNTFGLSASPGSALDLAADQCTIYYGCGNAVPNDCVLRYNMCQHQTTGSLTSLNVAPASLRLLADGTLLVAGSPAVALSVVHVTSTGSLLRTYMQVCCSVALDIDTTSFWSAAPGGLVKLDISSGQIHIGPVNVGGSTINSITVVGEPRAATSPQAIAAIPFVSPLGLLLLAMILAVVSCIRLGH
jgi:hypothetical protein